MDKQITILHVIESLGVGGAEKSLVQAVNGMPGYRHIVAILHEPDTLKDKLTDARVINLAAHSIWQRWKAVKQLKQIIDAEQVDLVHAQLFNSTLVGRIASRGRVPFIFTLQSMLGEDLFKKDFVSRLLEKITYSKKNYLIAVSNEALNDYKKYIQPNQDRSTVIYNSIEQKFFAPSYKSFTPGRKVRLIAVGNLKPLKNYDYILDALKMIPGGLFELDIYGAGPHKDFLQQRIETEQLPVVLKGNVSDLQQRIGQYDIYLHCSKYEGSSLAIFEAMASGLPVIVSDIPVLRENTGGFSSYVDLQQPGDLAQKLIAVQKGELDINERGSKGFEWVKTVAHPSVVLAHTVNFYTKVLSENSK
jgi:glycosyltransferase involved in cell wall biosynthesis